mmetsp:Transcript_48556/g.143325  ORF Transcript_48556/g.143325 Transcript_48556/m.143325 type:complete len:266 (-) Transcript_48556:126-923(-)
MEAASGHHVEESPQRTAGRYEREPVEEPTYEDWMPGEPEEGGCELLWPAEGEGDFAYAYMGQALAEAMAEKGYCVIQTRVPAADRESVIDETYEAQSWLLPKKQFESAYLGIGSKDKYFMLPDTDYEIPYDADGNLTVDRGLLRCDGILTNTCLLLEQLASPTLGYEPWGRMNCMVRMPFAGQQEEEELRPKPLGSEDYTDGRVVGHLNFVERRRELMILCVENEGGELTLFPKSLSGEESKPIRIPLARNKLICLNHQTMSMRR